MIGTIRPSRNRLHVNDEGVSTVEFALLFVPFLVLLLGGLDLGHHLYVRGVAQGALDDVSRRASVESATVMAGTDPLNVQIENAIKEQVDPVAPDATYDISQNSYYDFAGVGKPEPIIVDHNSDGAYSASDEDCFADTNGNGRYDTNSRKSGIGGADDIAFYEVRIRMKRLFPIAEFVGFSPDLDFTIKTAVRNQPYAERASPEVLCGVT